MAPRRAVSLTALPDPDDPLGLREITAAAFAAPAEAAAVQRVPLPASEAAAQRELARRRQALAQGEARLRAAGRRLARVDVALAQRRPEAQLWRRLTAPSKAVAEAQVQQDRRSWEAFVRELRRSLSHPVQVQTQFGPKLAGYTAMNWTGDVHTIWAPLAAPWSRDLHQETFDLVVAKLTARLHLFVVVSTGAAHLAARLSGGPVTAAWAAVAAWRFVRDVIEALRRQPELQS
jgi:hypothetical protein